MTVFGIDRFQVLDINGGTISARVGWPDDERSDYDPAEEIQEISWKIDDDPMLCEALHLMDSLAKNGFIDNDKITASEGEITSLTGLQIIDAPAALQKLCSIKVDMIDEGQKSDFFFLHT